MSLTLTGLCLDTSTEIVNGPTGPFESTTITMISGEGADSVIEKVRAGRDLRKSDWPGKGEEVSLVVVVSPYAGRNGAGYRLTALARVQVEVAV